MTTCPKSGKLLKSAGLTVKPLNEFVRLKMRMLGITQQRNDMNLSLLQRPKKIKKGTKTMYVYHPAVVTTSNVIEPGTVLKVLDVFKGDNTSTTTLKVMTANDWDDHTWGRDGLDACNVDYYVDDPDNVCECQKELSEMSAALKERVHYVLLSDVGK